MKTIKPIIGLLGILAAPLAIAQDQRSHQLAPVYQFKVNMHYPPDLDCTKTFSMVDEFMKEDCYTSNSGSCPSLRSAMKMEFSFEFLNTENQYEFLRAYSIDDRAEAPKGSFPSKSWDFSKVFYQSSYSTGIDQYQWSFQETGIPVKKILDSLRMKDAFLISRVGNTENQLKITNKLLACMFDAKKIKFTANGTIGLYGYHPKSNEKEKILNSVFGEFNEIAKRDTKNSRKYFLAGIAAAKAFRELNDVNERNLQPVFEESGLSVLAILLNQTTDDFLPLFSSKEEMKETLLEYPTEKFNANLEISN